jgi:hypothetical protein
MALRRLIAARRKAIRRLQETVIGYGHAPAWAGGGDKAPPLDDPIWQHALCDRVNHTVTWHLPGEEETSTDMHSVFIQIGRQLQTNLDRHNGGRSTSMTIRSIRVRKTSEPLSPPWPISGRWRAWLRLSRTVTRAPKTEACPPTWAARRAVTPPLTRSARSNA